VLAVDPNMYTALQWASELGSSLVLPASLKYVKQRAELVKAIGPVLVRDSILLTLSENEKSARLNEVGSLSKTYIPDVKEDRNRINIALRLWSGCISAAKTIALQTMSGPNTPQKRESIFRNTIDPLAQTDAIFRAGVEAAPAFKSLLKEEYSFEGVPETSAVRKYLS